MNKYDCLDCGGTGKEEVHSPDYEYTQNCRTCSGSGKRKITINLEEYDKLKSQALPQTEQSKAEYKACRCKLCNAPAMCKCNKFCPGFEDCEIKKHCFDEVKQTWTE